MILPPDFFLSSKGESYRLSEPRACWRRKRLHDNIRDDYLLVDIEPPVIGQDYGLGDKDIKQLVLATRHQGVTLFPVNEWSASVYVYRILDQTLLMKDYFDGNQVEMIAWAFIFRSLEDIEKWT
jgi:hypothetical protein